MEDEEDPLFFELNELTLTSNSDRADFKFESENFKYPDYQHILDSFEIDCLSPPYNFKCIGCTKEHVKQNICDTSSYKLDSSRDSMRPMIFAPFVSIDSVELTVLTLRDQIKSQCPKYEQIIGKQL